MHAGLECSSIQVPAIQYNLKCQNIVNFVELQVGNTSELHNRESPALNIRTISASIAAAHGNYFNPSSNLPGVYSKEGITKL